MTDHASPSIIVPDELAVGPRPREGGFAVLRQLGISAVLCLQEADEEPDPSAEWLGGLAWARVPVADGHAGGMLSLAQLGRAVEQIRRWRGAGRMVYVHCYLGIGRSPTVCAAYLAAVHGLSLGEALARVKAARPCTSPTAQQLGVLAQYVAEARGRVRDNNEGAEW